VNNQSSDEPEPELQAMRSEMIGVGRTKDQISVPLTQSSPGSYLSNQFYRPRSTHQRGHSRQEIHQVPFDKTKQFDHSALSPEEL
jgi:hypothetical protein